MTPKWPTCRLPFLRMVSEQERRRNLIWNRRLEDWTLCVQNHVISTADIAKFGSVEKNQLETPALFCFGCFFGWNFSKSKMGGLVTFVALLCGAICCGEFKTYWRFQIMEQKMSVKKHFGSVPFRTFFLLVRLSGPRRGQPLPAVKRQWRISAEHLFVAKTSWVEALHLKIRLLWSQKREMGF